MSNWLLVLLEPARTVLTDIGQFLVNLLLVIIILIVGWIVSRIIKAVVVKGLTAAKIDKLSEAIELDTVLAKGGIKYSLAELIGVVCYWIAILLTIIVAVNAVGLTSMAALLNNIVLYIPNIIAAIFILIAGMFIATLLRNIVQTTASNAGISEVKLLSKAVETIVMVFAIIISLEQLNISARILELTVGIVLASLGLAFAIAVGFGCRDIAEKLVAELVEKLRKK